jgi:catechol 2,3-dioxygenase-like lactoylglutathione lyase family enzyme
MTPIEVLGTDHVDVTVNDLERSIAFYEKVLGALGFRRLDNPDYIAWHNAHLGIGIRPSAPAERGAVFNRYRVGFHHLALRVKHREVVHFPWGYWRRVMADGRDDRPRWAPK